MLYLQSKSPFFLPVAAGDDDIIKHTPLPPLLEAYSRTGAPIKPPRYIPG